MHHSILPRAVEQDVSAVFLLSDTLGAEDPHTTVSWCLVYLRKGMRTVVGTWLDSCQTR